ncbi:MAG: hypothetical protein Q7R85_04475 [bacterium]|nr:hypothetical protein [bacterium]
MSYSPKAHDFSEATLAKFVGGQLEVLVLPALGGLHPRRYRGEVRELAYVGTVLRFRFARLEEKQYPLSVEKGKWFGGPAPEDKWFTIDLAAWDVVKSTEAGSIVFLHYATGSMATLRPSASEKLPKAESVNL